MQIRKTIKTTIPLCLSVVSLMSCNGGNSFTKKATLLYAGKVSDPMTLEEIYYSNSKKGIPYISLEYAKDFLNDFYHQSGDKNYNLSIKKDGDIFKFERENGSYLTFNFELNTVYSDNINLFKENSYSVNEFDCAGVDPNFYDESGKKIEGQVKYLTPIRSLSFATKPNATLISLGAYSIDTYRNKGKYLVPFQTFYNIAGPSTVSCIFNGESFFISGQQLANHGDEYVKKFYSTFSPTTRSSELKEYNYNEFARDLDYNYGLAKEHGISSFYSFFENNGLKDLLKSDSRYDEDKAYNLLQLTYLADHHTGFTNQNAYGGYDEGEAKKIASEISLDPQLLQKETKKAERTAYRINYGNLDKDNGIVRSPITQTDDTLIVTFDHFVCNQKGVDYYYTEEFKNKTETEYLKDNPGDTVALVHYANQRIFNDVVNKENKIKNVVIDLTGNGGGQAHTAAFTLAWLNSGVMQIEDPINGNRGGVYYNADVNFDKKIDDSDNLFKYFTGKVYCLTSETSFSCGNYVPAMLKQNGKVKLVGTKSGGGACVVRVGSTADGSGFCYSGNKKLCRAENGSYYSIDEGVNPDYFIDSYETLYGGNQTQGQASDRKNLVTYINGLK